MSFINPFFLYFLPLASIPVILHILNKSRYKKVEFSSLQFLSELKNDVIKKLKLKQLLLLIIRTLIIIFIILIFARPVITTRQSVAKIKRGESVYLLIDNSFSLRKSAKGVTLFANQLDRIMAQLEDAAYPINVKIITSTRPEEFEFAGLVDNFDQFREILLTLETNANQGRNLAALATIKSDITREQLVSPIIWIMSDFQRETDNYLQEFPQKLAELPTERILLFPAKYQQENYAIVESLFPDQILELNNDLTISAIVDHEGEEGKIPLSLFLESERAGRSTLDFKGRSRIEADFSFVPTQPGVLNGNFSLSTDRFTGDNDHYFSIHIPEKIRILYSGEGKEQDHYIPKAVQARANQRFELKFVSSNRFATQDLFSYDVVILSDLQGVNINLIESYLTQGGGIFIIPDRTGSRDGYNKLARELDLPIWRETLTFSRNNYIKLGNIAENHPIFQNIWQGERQLPAHFYQVPVFDTGDNQIVASYENGDPFLVLPSNRSNILLMATNPAENWSDIQFTGMFAPLVHRILSFLGGQTEYNFSFLVGDTIHLENFNIDDYEGLRIATPDGDEFKPETRDGKRVFSRSRQAGIYDIYRKNRKIRSFAVNVSPQEKQCRYLSLSDLKNKDTDSKFIIYDKNNIEGRESAGEISYWILLLVFSLAAIETWLTKNE